MKRGWGLVVGVAAAIALVLVVALFPGNTPPDQSAAGGEVAEAETAQLPTGPRTDLRVLVLRDGTEADPVGPIVGALDARGVPHTIVELDEENRPTIDADFLADTLAEGEVDVGTVDGPRAKFQALVLPEAQPKNLSADELRAIHDYQARYGIRALIAGAAAVPQVGLQDSSESGYSGSLDGMTATVTPAGLADPFRYLKGTVPFPDRRPDDETFGAFAPAASSTFTPLVTMQVPNTNRAGSIVGALAQDGREDLIVTFVMELSQLPTLALAQGMITWLTKDVHLGLDRSAFNVHIDDVFLPNYTWNTELNCTPGSGDCGSTVDEPAFQEIVRMTPSDVDFLRQWQQDRNFILDIVYNAVGVENEQKAHDGVDAMAAELIEHQDEFTWINHTWSHAFLGCLRDFSVVPWQCQTSLTGAVQWTPTSTIVSEIQRNVVWAEQNGIQLEATEVVTGEHGGMRRPPQEMEDNPNFIKGLSQTDVTVIASDHTYEKTARHVGEAVAIPRYPVNIFYDTAAREGAVDQYNYRYTSAADGGSGDCEADDENPCLKPLESDDEFDETIVPTESDIALSSVLANDPRTFYSHQSNLVNADPEGALLYAYLDDVLTTYRSVFADNRPLLQRSFTDGAAELLRQETWRQAVLDGEVTGYVAGDKVVVENHKEEQLDAPLTGPEGTLKDGQAWGTQYAAKRSDWITLASQAATVRTLPRAPWSNS